ncbi:hypothetical protein BU25DRAFT_406579 [Macroventuria anomochaeta]|uniref:Uncharacterized protein n=1 Tax=Macroventuria anomochaeta TaxID=301207 RepID=A0ACB6SF08_9PLEO|nr:uncharacterized protein BU25DRAFT_406579 [Macroventuria anomochaeta]KAF2632067.1 hypothetical protein BU25DRAFT_406579 [Macroventuria anomochaeta]
MMAATGLPLFYTDQQSHAASSYISPASTIISDSSFSWNMAPRTESNPNAPQPRRSVSPRTTATPTTTTTVTSNNNRDGGFAFIVGNTPAEMKSKKHMTTVRKRAMRAYLEANKEGAREPKNLVTERSRVMSEDSAGSQSNIESQYAAIANAANEESTIPNGLEGISGGMQSSAAGSTYSHPSQQPSRPEAHRPAGQRAHEDTLETALIAPPRTNDHGMPLPYDREAYPLFVSFGEGVDPFKTMFQSSYPRVSVERMKFLCARFFGTYAMGQHWIPTVLSAPHTFLSTLCCASAHLDAIFERDIESVETSSLRQEVMHLIGQNMVHPGKQVGDLNITALIQLIVSEVIGREEISLRIHEAGLEKMISLRGGLNQLGMRGYLASTCSWVLLESAILREERPRDIFSNYCTARSTKRHPVTAIIPESPIYRPRPQFETLRRSRYYKKRTLELLNDIQSMIELFVNPTNSSRRDSRTLLSFYRDITTKYPPVSQNQRPTQDDYKYEAIRITAILQATAIVECIPLSKALPHAATTVLGTPYSFVTSSHSINSPTSPLSPMNLRHDSLTSPGTVSSYANSLTFQSSSSYFDASRSSLSSMTTSHPSISSTVSHPSSSSIATSHSSVSSMPDSRPSYHLSSFRPSRLLTTSSPNECNPFADYITAPTQNTSTALLLKLKVALDASNMSECWQDMAGVLLWIGLTVGAASHRNGNRILEKWYSALSMRASVLLCFQYPEAIHSTMLTMGRLVDTLREPDSSSTANATRALIRRDSEAPGNGKKRRT